MDAAGRLFLSVVTIHEIEKGIALLGAALPTQRPSLLEPPAVFSVLA